MDIGGNDLVFWGRLDTQAPDFVWRMLRAAYPRGYAADANVAKGYYPLNEWNPGLWKLPCEIFVYPDFPREFGPKERPHGFLHIFMTKRGITIVVDSDPEDLAQVKLVNEIMLALRVNHLLME